MHFDNLTQARKSLEPHIFKDIHRKAVQVSEDLKSKEIELIKILQTVEAHMVHRYAGYNSLFNYAHKALGLSKAQSYLYCALAKKSKACKLLYKTLESGDLSPSKSSRLLSVITPENEEHWVSLAVSKTKRELEKEIAKLSPKISRPDKAKYINENTLEINTCLSEKAYNQLKRAQDIICQNKKKKVDFDEVIEELSKFYLERKDPVEKAKRVVKKLSGSSESKKVIKAQSEKCRDLQKVNKFLPGQKTVVKALEQQLGSTPPSPQRVKGVRGPINSRTRHRIYLRDQGKCQFIHSDGSLCLERRWIDLHHIQPVSNGGTDDINNLVTLCWGHHKAIHQRYLN